MYASLAGKTDVPPSVAKKFVGPEAHSQGGALKESKMAESKKMVAKEMAFMKKKGAPKSMIKHEMAEAKGKGYASGGGIRGAKTVTKTGTPQEEFAPNYRTPVRSPGLAFAKGGESSPGLEGYNPYAKGGMTKKFAKGGESSPGLEGYNPYAKGGSVRGGGIESKGKTKGKMVKMAMGGKAC